jgi:DnaK suppressor protein
MAEQKQAAEGCNLMDESLLEPFKLRLQSMQAELAELEDTSKNATRPVQLDQQSVGRLSRMDAMQSQQMAQESARRRQLLLTGIEGALRRIESGDFGYCFVCDEEIDIRRLEADPTITRCIKCADKGGG